MKAEAAVTGVGRHGLPVLVVDAPPQSPSVEADAALFVAAQKAFAAGDRARARKLLALLDDDVTSPQPLASVVDLAARRRR